MLSAALKCSLCVCRDFFPPHLFLISSPIDGSSRARDTEILQPDFSNWRNSLLLLTKSRPSDSPFPCCSPELLEAKVVFCKMFTLSKHTGKWSFVKQLRPEGSNRESRHQGIQKQPEEQTEEKEKWWSLEICHPAGKTNSVPAALFCAWQTDR